MPAQRPEGKAAISRQLRLALVPVLIALVLLAVLAVVGAPSAQDGQPAPATGSPPPATVAAQSPAAAATGAAAPTPTLVAASSDAPVPTDTPASETPGASPSPAPPAPSTPRPSPTASPPPVGPVIAVVPVVGFWSGATDISSAELKAAIEGRGGSYERVVLPTREAGDVALALGLSDEIALETGDPRHIRRAVADGALGLLRLDDVTPAVRALSLDGRSLFGNDRLDDLADWPLAVPDASDDAADRWDPAQAWTLVAGGDLQLDRRMAYQVTTLGRGVDFPFDGGTVRITGRECCGRFGHRVPLWERTGNEGVVRDLFTRADVAMANLEAAAVRDPALHPLKAGFLDSLNFSGDPALLEGLRNAGFDFVSLANNHIHNGGPAGITDTREELDELGIRHAGAGSNLRQASRPSVLDVSGTTVAVVPCTTIGSKARAQRPGARSCHGGGLTGQIRALARDSDVVIVFPHWGREYRSEPTAGQRRLAASWISAGADLVLGAHPHWAGAIEDVDGRLVFYSMGNLTFDQPWSVPTMQGLIVELTFIGDELVQAWLHPTLIVEDVQPNLLEHDGGGSRVLKRMRDASRGLLDY
jgi:hypothetical protein